MMQVYIDAIEASRKENTQYVLTKSLDVVRLSDKRKLYSMLKDGYDIKGIYHNGIGEYDYILTSTEEVKAVKKFLNSTLKAKFLFCNQISIRFQEIFKPISCETEELRCFVVLHYDTTKSPLAFENLFLKEDDAKALQEVLFRLNCKQDKEKIVKILEVSNNVHGGLI